MCDRCNAEEPTLRAAVAEVERKIGKTIVSDADIVLIACGEISRTFTRDEKGYA